MVPAWVAGFCAAGAPLGLLEPLVRRGVDVSVVETVEWNPQSKSSDPALVNRFPLGHLVSATNPQGALAWFQANPGRINEVDSRGMGLLHRLASTRWSDGANQGFVWAPFVRAVMEAGGDLGALTPQGFGVLHLLLENPSAWWVESFEDVIVLLHQASPGLMEQPDKRGRRPWEMLAEWLREKEQEIPLRSWPKLKALLHCHRLNQTLEEGIPAGETGRARL
ncbi:MAG: hypothetical protein DI568_18310 [Sphingomonas sp.]|nr:MAG: hypothetical protein DI568_18310 [Sphingomonas sp.]